MPRTQPAWIDPATRAVIVPDLAGRREGKTYGIDVHAHSATSTSAHSLTDRVAYADTIKRNGKGAVEAYHRARVACEAADAAARAGNCPQLVARARTMRSACNQAHHGGCEIAAAAAAGDTFLPAARLAGLDRAKICCAPCHGIPVQLHKHRHSKVFAERCRSAYCIAL